MIHSASIISFINAGLNYPRSVFLIEKWKETTFTKNNNNFKDTMRDFVRSNSFFQKLVFPVAWNVTKQYKDLSVKIVSGLSQSGFSNTIRWELEINSFSIPILFIPLIFCKFPLHIAVPQIALLFSIFSVRYWYTCYNISIA